MTDETVREVRRGFETHESFEQVGEAYSVTTSPFEATVTVESTSSDVAFHVEVRVPTLDASVEDEVAPVVQEGWFETFERRLEDVGGATRVDPTPPLVQLQVHEGQVRVETDFRTQRAVVGVEDAKAIVDFVEGTYVEGIIPGYDYVEPVADLLGRAKARSQGVDPAETGR